MVDPCISTCSCCCPSWSCPDWNWTALCVGQKFQMRCHVGTGFSVICPQVFVLQIIVLVRDKYKLFCSIGIVGRLWLLSFFITAFRFWMASSRPSFVIFAIVTNLSIVERVCRCCCKCWGCIGCVLGVIPWVLFPADKLSQADCCVTIGYSWFCCYVVHNIIVELW